MPERSDAATSAVMSRDQVLAEAKQIVGELMSIAPDKIKDTSSLEGDLGCDSLDLVEITMEVEEHFDISVPDDVEERIRTVNDIADGVLELLRQPQAD